MPAPDAAAFVTPTTVAVTDLCSCSGVAATTVSSVPTRSSASPAPRSSTHDSGMTISAAPASGARPAEKVSMSISPELPMKPVCHLRSSGPWMYSGSATR